MKKIISLLAACLLIGSAVLFEQCKCKECEDPTNPACPNYDPCYGKRPAKADFIMQESLDYYGKLFAHAEETDTVIAGNMIFFTPTDTAADVYEWRVGSDPRVFTDKVLRLEFPPVGRVDINLTLRYKQNPACGFAKDSVSTKVKWLTVVPVEQSKMLGFFHGYLESNPLDTFTVEMGHTLTHPRRRINYYENFPKGCVETKNLGSEDASFGYKTVVHDVKRTVGTSADVAGCAAPYFMGRLDGSNRITLDVIRNDVSNPANRRWVKDKFIGQKR